MNLDDVVIQGELVYYAHQLSPEFKNLIILPISDLHYGNPLFSLSHFKRTLKFLEEPNVFGFLNGDLCESSIRTSKGEIFRQVGTPQDQRDWVIEQFLPVKDKLLGMTIGNHEERIYNEVGVDICQDIAKALGIPYRASGMSVKISFGDNNNYTTDRPYTYWGYFTHGYGGARTKSAKAVKVERTATWLHSDFYCMAHDHVVNVAPDVYLMPDPRTREEKTTNGEKTGFTVGSFKATRKMLIKSNAYLKWGGYSERLGFPPVDLETPLIKLAGEGGRPKVNVEI